MENSENCRRQWTVEKWNKLGKTPWKTAIPLECPTLWMAEFVSEIPVSFFEKESESESTLSAYLDKHLNYCRYSAIIERIWGSDKPRSSTNTNPRKNRKARKGMPKCSFQQENENPEKTIIPRQIYGDCSSKNEWIATALCLSSVHTYLRNKRSLQTATALLSLCRNEIGTHGKVDGFSGYHLEAYRYLIEANEWALQRVKIVERSGARGRKTTSKEKNYKMLRLKKALPSLMEKWSVLKRNKRKAAAVLFVRGRLASILGMPDEFALERYRRCVQLEPDCYLWHRVAYQKRRQMRKEEYDGQNHYAVSRDEIQFSERAYELRPLIPENILNFAMMRKESKLGGFGVSVEQRQEEAFSVLESLSNLESILPTKCRFVLRAKILQADIHFIPGLQLSEENGLQILRECAELWPKRSSVIHKLGKYFNNRWLRDGIFEDFTSTKDLFLEGLKLNPKNYPLAMDFLKLAASNVKENYGDIIQVIDECLKRTTSHVNVVKLLTMRGLYVWSIDGTLNNLEVNRIHKIIACNFWIQAITAYRWLKHIVMELIREGCASHGIPPVDRQEAKDLFSVACWGSHLPLNLHQRRSIIADFCSSLLAPA